MEVLLVFGFITGLTFLGVNVFLHLFFYPVCLLFENVNHSYGIYDSKSSHNLLKEFMADVWIPVLKGTIAFSVICGVVGTLLLCLRLVVNQMV